MAKLKIGDKAIPFELPGVDGQDHALGDYADKEIVVLFFGCNHCPYVLAWEDRLIQTQADYADRGVQFIEINPNDPEKYAADSFPNMKKHAEEKGFNFPYLFDETQEVARYYGAERTPEMFVFDKDRILRYHGAPDDNYERPEEITRHYLRDALDAILTGQTPVTPETPPVGCTIKWK